MSLTFLKFSLVLLFGLLMVEADEEACNGDRKAVANTCTSACQPTCAERHVACTDQCVNGCECKPGFILNRPNGRCIPEVSCPVSPCGGDPNAVSSSCASPCQPTCREPTVGICGRMCIVDGCVCKPGYILDQPNGKCIDNTTCPKLINSK